MQNQPLISLRDVSKAYPNPTGHSFTALNNINLQLEAGHLWAILGKSGSGKSTLLNLLAGLDQPTRGEVWVGGQAIHAMSEDALARWRGRNVGMVFQFFQLLPTLTVLENVVLAMDLCRAFPKSERRKWANNLLDLVGIADQADKLPSTLSGGQQQRAAIARALANDPPLMLADEPTGNLDSQTSETVLDLFTELVKLDKTVIVVTHDQALAQRAQRIIQLSDGTLVNDLNRTTTRQVTNDSIVETGAIA